MPKNLFGDFQPVTSKQWKQQIQFELKGADYSELVWESPEGIKVRPFYHSDEEIPFSGTGKTETGFSICQDIFVYDLEKSILRAKSSLKRGAESIRFIIQDESIDAARLVTETASENVTLYFSLSFFSEDIIQKIDTAAEGKNCRVFILVDPVHQLASDGNWFKTSGKDNFNALDSISKQVKNVGIISADASLYQNAGANIVQQIAYTLTHLCEYFNRVETIEKPVVIRISVGSNYFFEIAKLRALRNLFRIIAKEFNHNIDCHILAVPSKRNKTIYDYNVNMLRTTTECMSAILGGADSISNLPYDALYHKSNEFGERISRNQLLIMQHESYLDKVGNAADGSYYIETLTRQLSEKALLLFKDIEANGGFVKQLIEGTIQRKISESAEKEQQLFDSGKEVLLGTNKYPNRNDRMAHDLELFPFVKTKPRKTLITPIIEKRLAEKMEQERLETEKPI